MSVRSKLTLLDRVALAGFSAVFGLVTALLVWLALALTAGVSSIGIMPFAFAIGTFAAAGFIIGPAFSEALGVWMQGVFGIFSALTYNWGADLGRRPFQPYWATAFVFSVAVVTFLLALA